MEDRILNILRGIRPEVDFEGSEDFIEDGYLDSFDIVSIVDEIERTFNIIVDGLDVIPENFNNIEAICNLINKCKGM